MNTPRMWIHRVTFQHFKVDWKYFSKMRYILKINILKPNKNTFRIIFRVFPTVIIKKSFESTRVLVTVYIVAAMITQQVQVKI